MGLAGGENEITYATTKTTSAYRILFETTKVLARAHPLVVVSGSRVAGKSEISLVGT